MRLLLSVLALAGLMAALPAAAQDVRVLQDRLQRLEAELVQLQRQVYRGGAGGAAGPVISNVPEQGGIMSQMLVRLDDIESQIRSLTGRIEESEHRNRQLQQRLDKLVADVDFRLNALERGGAGTTGTPGEPQAATGAAPGSGPVPAPGPAASAGGPAAAPGLPPGTVPGPGAPPTTLGTIPAGAVPPARPAQTAAAPPPAAAPAGKLPAGTPQERYNYAVKLLQQGDYADAERALGEFLSAHPRDPLAANAQYWVGESFFARKQFDRAAQAFLAGYQKYPKSAKAPDNLLKLSMSLASLNQKQEACAVLKQLSTEFPQADASVKQSASREAQRNGCK